MTRPLRLYACVTNDLTYDQRMRRMAEAWVMAGYEVTMVGRQKAQSVDLTWPGVRCHRLRLHAQSGPMMYASYNRALYRYLCHEAPDIIVAADVDTLLGGAAAARSVGAKLVFDAHEWFTEVPELIHSPMKRWLWHRVGRWGVKRADLCYTVNASLAEIFSSAHGKTFHVIRNVPMLEPYHYTSPEEKIILYQGALNEGRGLVPLINAMSSLPDCSLHLAGEGDLSSLLRDLAKSSPAQNRIHFHGYVNPTDLLDLTRRAYIGVNLLETTSQNYYYSLANKFFDYMHAGVPSLNMDYPEYTKVLDEYPCGRTIARSDVASIVEAIKAMSSPDVYDDMVASALDARAHFNWQSERKLLIELYSGL